MVHFIALRDGSILTSPSPLDRARIFFEIAKSFLLNMRKIAKFTAKSSNVHALVEIRCKWIFAPDKNTLLQVGAIEEYLLAGIAAICTPKSTLFRGPRSTKPVDGRESRRARWETVEHKTEGEDWMCIVW